MRNLEENIKMQLAALGKGKVKTFIATVENNHPDKDVIDARDLSGVLFTDIRKMASIGDNNGILVTPVTGSTVLVSRIDDSDELFISMFSRVESIIINGGQNGGLTITPELKKQLDKTNALLTAILNVINGTPVPETGNGVASSLQTALKTAIAGKQIGDFSDIENTKITH